MLEKNAGSPRTRIPDGCEPRPCGHWEEHPVFLTSEPSLQPEKISISNNLLKNEILSETASLMDKG